MNIVILKREWDFSPHIDDNKIVLEGNSDGRWRLPKISDINRERFHCHVIRRIEKDYLMDFFRRRREGALLVCGRRGVGKTSAITAAILASQGAEIEKRKDEQKAIDRIKLLPVLVNAPNFEIRKVNVNEIDKSENTGDF